MMEKSQTQWEGRLSNLICLNFLLDVHPRVIMIKYISTQMLHNSFSKYKLKILSAKKGSFHGLVGSSLSFLAEYKYVFV